MDFAVIFLLLFLAV